MVSGLFFGYLLDFKNHHLAIIHSIRERFRKVSDALTFRERKGKL